MSRWLRFVFAAWMGAALAAQPDAARVVRAIASGIDAQRQKAGVGPLAPDPRLAKAAQSFAEYLARADRLDHDADGSNAGERMRRAGYRWCAYAENIAYEFNTRGFESDQLARLLVRDWIESAGHRRNLLDARMKDTGVGLAQSAATKRWYAVQVFGRGC